MCCTPMPSTIIILFYLTVRGLQAHAEAEDEPV